MVVLRTMLGFTPPEWAYAASQNTDVDISQSFARTFDRGIRMHPRVPLKLTGTRLEQVLALIETAARLLSEGNTTVAPSQLHRLDKMDTRFGGRGIRNAADMGVPYAMLLYERFLGRPFAGHRDSVSELVGDTIESTIEDILTDTGISYRKTKRAESIEGFDQTPDFVIPSEFNPQVVIEAKLSEDDGTARDKVTQIQHLDELSSRNQAEGHGGFEVIACISGRGFGTRRSDMEKLIHATRGKVFTLATLDYLVESTRLKEFRSK